MASFSMTLRNPSRSWHSWASNRCIGGDTKAAARQSIINNKKLNTAKNDFQYGWWNSYTLQCGMIMTLISPGDCTLQCGMWLWNRDSKFTKWQHPAMWYVALRRYAIQFARWQHPAMWHVALESWHWIRQVEFYIWFRFRLHHRSWHVILHQDHPRQKKMTSCQFSRWRISAMLDFIDLIMGSLKSPITTY